MKRNKNTEKNYILITGADSGIGKQFAIQYSNIGYKIILTARNLEKLKAVQAELKTESVIIIKDLSIMDNCYELLKEVEQYKIDMFINNAGFGDFGLIEETNTEKALKMTDLNCKASLILIKEFIKRFNKENSEKKILAVASAAAFCPAPYMAEYYATKAYLFRLVLGYRQELIDQKSKVKLSILCPGPVKTNFEEVANVKFQIKSLSAEKVVKYTIKKQKKNKTVIVPGAMIKCGHFLSKFANEKFACKVLDKVAKNPNN